LFFRFMILKASHSRREDIFVREKSRFRNRSMDEPRPTRPLFWMDEKGPTGEPIDSVLIEAASRIFERVAYLTELQLHDLARAPQVLEQSVYDVAATMRHKTAEDEKVENLEAYLYRAVVRKINDIQARERRIEYVQSLELLERLAAGGRDDWVTAFQRDLQLEETLSHLDPRTREIFTRRASGDSWDEVAKAMGISDGDNARSLFRYGVRKARERLLKRNRPKTDQSEE